LNFLTLHGKSRFPGLDIWLRDGTKVPVSVPDGCLLVQAGMQIEYLTGGLIQAGWHEVVVNQKTIDAIERAKKVHFFLELGLKLSMKFFGYHF
jgi:isopenicillin N synthase-like dioxygenase